MSTLRTNTLSNAAGSASVPVDTVISGSAKAWVNFNGTGTVAIRGSFNVSSITDNGTGDYTVNFTTAMTDANYAAVTTASRSTGQAANNVFCPENGAVTSSSMRGLTRNTQGTAEDQPNLYVAIFR